MYCVVREPCHLSSKEVFIKVVESALYYGAKCLALRKEDERKLLTTGMRMLRLICGKTLKDCLSNHTIRDITGAEKIKEFIREHKLRWFGHSIRMDDERTH